VKTLVISEEGCDRIWSLGRKKDVQGSLNSQLNLSFWNQDSILRAEKETSAFEPLRIIIELRKGHGGTRQFVQIRSAYSLVLCKSACKQQANVQLAVLLKIIVN